MGPKINRLLKLKNGGKKVKVVGPVGGWDPGIDRATFWVVVTQVQGDKFVVATGDSDETYKPPDANWDADAEVDSRWGGEFIAGPAFAWAVASFRTNGGNYVSFQWEVDVQLEV